MGEARWAIVWDGGNQEDMYSHRPSEFVLRQTQRACPDEPVLLYHLVDGWNYELVEEWPALGGEPRG